MGVRCRSWFSAWAWVWVSLFPLALCAETAKPSPPPIAISLSLDQAIEIALANNWALKAEGEGVREASGEWLKAFRFALPTITGTASYERRFSKDSIFLPNARTGQVERIEVGKSNHYLFGAKVTQPIFDFGGMIFAIQSAGHHKAAARAAYAGAQQDLIYETTASYYTLSFLDETLALYARRFEQTQKRLAKADEEKALGLLTVYDVEAASIAAEQDELALLRAQDNWDRESRKFKSLLDLDPDVHLTLVKEKALPKPPQPFDALLEKAREQNPILKELRSSTQSLKDAWRHAQLQWAPRFDATFDYALQGETNQAFPEDEEFAESMSAGIAMTVPFFDGLKREGEIRSAKARYLRALYTLHQGIRDFESDLKATYDGLSLSLKDLELAQAKQRNARHHYEEAKTRRDLVLFTDIELEDAALADKAATLDLLEAKTNSYLAEAALLRLSADGGPSQSSPETR